MGWLLFLLAAAVAVASSVSSFAASAITRGIGYGVGIGIGLVLWERFNDYEWGSTIDHLRGRHNDLCYIQSRVLVDCLDKHGELSKCQNYLDALRKCRYPSSSDSANSSGLWCCKANY